MAIVTTTGQMPVDHNQVFVAGYCGEFQTAISNEIGGTTGLLETILVSGDLLDPNGVQITGYDYTHLRRPGGTVGRVAFSVDGVNWLNSSGSLVNQTGSMYFDGVDDYIDFGNEFNFGTNRWAIACWVMLDQNSAAQAIWDKRAGGTNAGWQLFQFDAGGAPHDKLQFFIRDTTANSVTVNTDIPLQTGVWHHILCGDNGGNAYVYVDGVLDTVNNSAAVDNVNNAIDFEVGRRSGSTSYLKGKIADIMVWSDATQLQGDAVVETIHDQEPREPDKLIRRWRFDGHTNPLFGTSNTGTLHGAIASSEAPNWEGDALGNHTEHALWFDGVDDYIDFGTQDEFSFAPNLPFSVQADVKPLNGSQYNTILSKGRINSGSYEWVFNIQNDDTLQLIMYDKSSGAIRIRAYSSSALEIGEWRNVAATYNGSASETGITLYVDGQEIAATRVMDGAYTGMTTSSYAMWEGAIQNLGSPSSPFHGVIANVALWSGVVDSGTIYSNYINGYLDTSDANLIGFWDANSGVGSTVSNSSSNYQGYNGTINGATWVHDIARPGTGEGQFSLDYNNLYLQHTFTGPNGSGVTPHQAITFTTSQTGQCHEMPVDWNAGIAYTVTGECPIEWTQVILPSGEVPTEWGMDFNTTGEMPVEWTVGGFAITSTGQIPVEWTQGLIDTNKMLMEWGGALQGGGPGGPGPTGSGPGGDGSGIFPVEWRGGGLPPGTGGGGGDNGFPSFQMPVEWRGHVIVLSDGEIPVEWTAILPITGDMPVEWGTLLYQSGEMPIEWTTDAGLIVPGVFPIEWTAPAPGVIAVKWCIPNRGTVWTQIARGTDWTLPNRPTDWNLTER